MPTDTIYGVVGSALRPRTVSRIYRLRRRNRKKPMIILIGNIADLKRFGIAPDAATRKLLKRYWPGPVSIILPLPPRPHILRQFRFLHRGTRTIAFRMPKPAWLQKLLAETSPLVAPSANWEGKPPARTIAEARRYFGNRVDCYFDAGPLAGKPSKIVKIVRKKAIIVRY